MKEKIYGHFFSFYGKTREIGTFKNVHFVNIFIFEILPVYEKIAYLVFFKCGNNDSNNFFFVKLDKGQQKSCENVLTLCVIQTLRNRGRNSPRGEKITNRQRALLQIDLPVAESRSGRVLRFQCYQRYSLRTY